MIQARHSNGSSPNVCWSSSTCSPDAVVPMIRGTRKSSLASIGGPLNIAEPTTGIRLAVEELPAGEELRAEEQDQDCGHHQLPRRRTTPSVLRFERRRDLVPGRPGGPAIPHG